MTKLLERMDHNRCLQHNCPNTRVIEVVLPQSDGNAIAT